MSTLFSVPIHLNLNESKIFIYEVVQKDKIDERDDLLPVCIRQPKLSKNNLQKTKLKVALEREGGLAEVGETGLAGRAGGQRQSRLMLWRHGGMERRRRCGRWKQAPCLILPLE
jgi:hypothetical protein